MESIFIEGHTDSDRYSGSVLLDNWDLSVVRATNTYRALTEFVPALTELCTNKDSRCEPILSVSGYGDKRPVPDNSGTEADKKRRNRRIDLRLIMVTPDSGAVHDAISNRLSQP